MGTGPKAPRRPDRVEHRAVNVQALLHNREFIKINAYLLPPKSKREVLERMDRLRRARTPDPKSNDPAVLPEMTSDEIVREINWRVGTLPPDDAEDVARFIRDMTRWRAERRRRAAGDPGWRPPAGS